MSKLVSRIAGFLNRRNLAGSDKAGNRYFAREEAIDGVVKEKRWVMFKGEEDPTSVPVEWICWLNGQRKKAPTSEEMMELEARRERVRQNVALLKKEEEERKLKEGTKLKGVNTGKVGGPDLPSFIRQFPTPQGENAWDVSDGMDEERRSSEEKDAEKVTSAKEFTEPTGSGTSYRPGTWQAPT